MTPITGIARKFSDACETGKGWDGCKPYCKPDATFSAQAEPLAGVKTLRQYTDWMKSLLTFIPDGRYELKSFGTDDERSSVWSEMLMRDGYDKRGCTDRCLVAPTLSL